MWTIYLHVDHITYVTYVITNIQQIGITMLICDWANPLKNAKKSDSDFDTEQHFETKQLR